MTPAARQWLQTISYYCTTLAVALPITTFWRLYIAEELGTDIYLYRLLHVTGLIVGAVTGTGVANWRSRP